MRRVDGSKELRIEGLYLGTPLSALFNPICSQALRWIVRAARALGPEQRRPRRLHAAAEWLGRSVAVVPVDAGRRAMAEKLAADLEENLELGT